MSNPGYVNIIESLVGLVSSSIVAMSSVVVSCPRTEICPGLGVMSETGVLQAGTSLDAVGLLLLLLHAAGDHVVVVVGQFQMVNGTGRRILTRDTRQVALGMVTDVLVKLPLVHISLPLQHLHLPGQPLAVGGQGPVVDLQVLSLNESL